MSVKIAYEIMDAGNFEIKIFCFVMSINNFDLF